MNETLFNRFVNKTVTFKFNHKPCQFHLSQSLFSSADVDDGSRLLLKAILKNVNLDAVKSVLDVGCGVGVLGLSLVNGRGQTSLTVQDRDALAGTFTQANAHLNEVNKIETVPGLGFQNLDGRRFDLIVSNLPGKAGEPVLQKILQQMPGHLTESGTAAVVIVKPLEALVASTLAEMGSELIYQTGSKMHTVFIFQGGQTEAFFTFPEPYFRGNTAFTADKIRYDLDTVYNLPDFDNQGYETRLALKMLDKEKLHGRVLFWNPGQGHLPVVSALLPKRDITEYVLGSRDGLSLQISAHNLQKTRAECSPRCHHQPTLLDLTETFDRLVIFPDDDPGVPWSNLLVKAAAERLNPGGKMLIIGKSGFIGRFLAERKGLRPLRQKKYHGLRAVWLEKLEI